MRSWCSAREVAVLQPYLQQCKSPAVPSAPSFIGFSSTPRGDVKSAAAGNPSPPPAASSASPSTGRRAKADIALLTAMNAHEGGKPKAQVLMLYKEAATLYLNYLETSKHFQRIAPEEQRDVQSKVESILQNDNP